MILKNKFSKLHILIISSLLLFSMLVLAYPIHAVTPVSGTAAYEITNFDYYAKVTKDHKYKVTEKISVNLTDDLESIEFTIPNGNYKIGDFKMNDTNYADVEKTFRIVDKKELKQGYHTYKLEFLVSEYADRDETKDIFYFDILPPGWFQAITELNIKVEFPSNFPCSKIKYFAGQYGVQNVDTKLEYSVDSAARAINITGSRIPENFGITLKADLPEGFWQGAMDRSWAMTLMIILSIAFAIALLVMWLVGGRDPQVSRVLQAHPVEGVTPAELSYVFNSRVRTRDVISLIIYFGTKGYLKISEYEPKRFRLIRVADPGPADEEKFIRTAFELLFEEVPIGRWIEMDDLVVRMRRIKSFIKEDVAAGFSSKEMRAYTQLSRIFRIVGSGLLTLSVGVFCALKYLYTYASINFVESILFMIATALLITLLCDTFDQQYYSEEKTFTIKVILLCAGLFAIATYIAVSTIVVTGQFVIAILSALLILVSVFLILIMRARGEGNAMLANRFIQLRHFIYHPDAKVLLDAYLNNKNYYYEVLPYALSFSGLETWAICFLTLKVPEPEWFSDDVEGQAFTNLLNQEKNVVDYARDIKAFARTIEDAYHTTGRQGRIRWQINKR